MIDTILTVLFVLIAIAMVALILMQRGAGAQAGSGFGAGASATVFGARGSANFLSSSTKWLAVVFFALSLFMAWKAVNIAAPVDDKAMDAGVMNAVPAVPESQAPQGAVPAPGAVIPVVPAPAPANAVPVLAPEAAPAAPAVEQDKAPEAGSQGG